MGLSCWSDKGADGPLFHLMTRINEPHLMHL